MIPSEKTLVARMAHRPFALIGIDSDGGPGVLQQLMARNGITWRNAVDGGIHGPLDTKWDIHSWPSIFVLDRMGFIRYRDVRGKALDEDVERLARETEAR